MAAVSGPDFLRLAVNQSVYRFAELGGRDHSAEVCSLGGGDQRQSGVRPGTQCRCADPPEKQQHIPTVKEGLF
jgi:hypothetical protein